MADMMRIATAMAASIKANAAAKIAADDAAAELKRYAAAFVAVATAMEALNAAMIDASADIGLTPPPGRKLD